MQVEPCHQCGCDTMDFQFKPVNPLAPVGVWFCRRCFKPSNSIKTGYPDVSSMLQNDSDLLE